jgi:thiol-disulfide isomerase/thioredoxin
MMKAIRPMCLFGLTCMLVGPALLASWPGGLLDRDATRLEKARETHVGEIDRAFKVYTSQVDRANNTLTRIYEPLIKQYENRGDRETAEQLQSELDDLRSKALTLPFPEDEEGAKDKNPAPPNSHMQLISAIGPEVINATGQRGQTSRLVEYDYVLLYFTAGWCAPCRAFTPQLIQYYNENRSLGKWEVIVVSKDHSESEFQDYLRSAKMPWAAIPYERVEPSGLSQRFQISGIPNFVVLDRTGNVVINSRSGGRDKALADFQARLRQ